MRFSRLLIFLFIGLAFLQASHYAPLLPERVASHFDAAGRADGWSSRSGFLNLNMVFVAGMGALFLGVTALINKTPKDAINLPNKDYWLAPERRAATLNTINSQMEWLAAATLALLLGITQLTIEANLAASAALPAGAFWLLFGSYIFFFVIWLVLLLRTWYARPPREDGAP